MSYCARCYTTHERSRLHLGASQAVGARDKIGALGSWAWQQVRGQTRIPDAMVFLGFLDFGRRRSHQREKMR